MVISLIQIIEIAVVILLYFILRVLLYKSIGKAIIRNSSKNIRAKSIRKVISVVLFVICIPIILIILGVEQEELAVFIGSVLTVIGIALFAQWSILSNITSGLIIFFNHSVKLGDTISILDKDYEVTGKVSDIGLFFVNLETNNGEIVTIPSNVLMQKMIKKKNI